MAGRLALPVDGAALGVAAAFNPAGLHALTRQSSSALG